MSTSEAAQASVADEFQRAVALHGQGQIDAAADIYGRILAQEPRHFDALHLLGVARMQRGDLSEAERFMAEAVTIKPDHGPSLSNLGVVLRTQRRLPEALEVFDRALLYPPVTPDTHYNRGLVLLDLERFAEALAAFDHALALAPEHARVIQNRGVTLDRTGRFEEAIACFNDALKLNPGDATLLHNLGHALFSLGRIDEAAERYRNAFALAPDLPEASMGLAECLLLKGEMEAGWRLYEQRWKTRIVTGGGGGALAPFARDFPMPLWRGEDIAGKTILLHGEQGFGDILQFCRYAPIVARRGAHVALEVPGTLARLLSCLDGVSEIHVLGAPLPKTDFHCPLMSLPLALGMTADKAPAAVPYVEAPPDLAARWSTRLSGERRPLIGLTWYGQRGPVKELHRSIPPEELASLGDLDATFIRLQLGLRAEDRQVPFLRDRVRQVDAELSDFADTAALVANLDLVVTVDTAMAHLAGAMGKPVWVLLPTVPEWRWGLSGTTSGWYPSARLFRQRRQGDWKPVIADVGAAIRRLAR